MRNRDVLPTRKGGILILTQAVDTDDPVLSFFHVWLTEFSRHFERITVVCLKEGKHSLPPNVRVHSLGKEKTGLRSQVSGFRRIHYVIRLYCLAWSLQHEYDAVLVHMNQEYVLLGGFLWKLMGKRVYLWRNHYAGSLMTDIAALFCDNVFCTSKFSYTAKYKKTILMPVGVDTTIFKPQNVERKKNAVLSLGRIAPSKRLEALIEALRILQSRGKIVEAEIVGEPLPRHEKYRDGLQKILQDSGLRNVRMSPGVRNIDSPRVYSGYDIFVNCSGSGMYDKTIFEAAACGCIVLASSLDFAELVPGDFSFEIGNAEELAARIEKVISFSAGEKERARATMRSIAERHSLHELGQRLAEAIQ